MQVPKAMSTQHPDNATPAPFAEDGVLKGDGEIAEAHHVFATLGCDEQMWDYEGKAADVDVVLKLLLRDPSFFRSRTLGKDIFLTLRIPNPSVEHELRKKVEEALHTIVTSYDLASEFYGAPVAPIFQVILPFTTSAEELVWIDSYYRQEVVGKQHHLLPSGQPVREWLGEHSPESIQMIPLVEDQQRLVGVDALVERYLALLGRPLPYMRVFLARSDPALNYGLVSAILMVKISLQRLHRLEKRVGIPLYPIIGVGGVPFRGNFRPSRVGRVLREYPSVQTFTVQSSFKYDHDATTAWVAVQEVLAHVRQEPIPVEEERALELMERSTRRYQEQVARLADLVNTMSAHVPRRRDRRLHIGLFGYSREAGTGQQTVRLPRAIGFAAAMYSLGVPPELLGLDALTSEDLAFLRQVAPHLEDDVADALRFANEASVARLLGAEGIGEIRRFGRDADREHQGLTSLIYDRVERGFSPSRTRQLVEWAAQTRGFLG